MSEGRQRTDQFAAWWAVMKEAIGAMEQYMATLDRSETPTADLERIRAELLAKTLTNNWFSITR